MNSDALTAEIRPYASPRGQCRPLIISLEAIGIESYEEEKEEAQTVVFCHTTAFGLLTTKPIQWKQFTEYTH